MVELEGISISQRKGEGACWMGLNKPLVLRYHRITTLLHEDLRPNYQRHLDPTTSGLRQYQNVSKDVVITIRMCDETEYTGNKGRQSFGQDAPQKAPS